MPIAQKKGFAFSAGSPRLECAGGLPPPESGYANNSGTTRDGSTPVSFWSSPWCLKLNRS